MAAFRSIGLPAALLAATGGVALATWRYLSARRAKGEEQRLHGEGSVEVVSAQNGGGPGASIIDDGARQVGEIEAVSPVQTEGGSTGNDRNVPPGASPVSSIIQEEEKSAVTCIHPEEKRSAAAAGITTSPEKKSTESAVTSLTPEKKSTAAAVTSENPEEKKNAAVAGISTTPERKSTDAADTSVTPENKSVAAVVDTSITPEKKSAAAADTSVTEKEESAAVADTSITPEENISSATVVTSITPEKKNTAAQAASIAPEERKGSAGAVTPITTEKKHAASPVTSITLEERKSSVFRSATPEEESAAAEVISVTQEKKSADSPVTSITPGEERSTNSATSQEDVSHVLHTTCQIHEPYKTSSIPTKRESPRSPLDKRMEEGFSDASVSSTDTQHKEKHESCKQVLVLGLDGSGKTSILNCISANKGKLITTPTEGVNAMCISNGNSKMEFLEIGGSEHLRPYWKMYLSRAFAVIFVVDSADHSRLSLAKRHLHQLIQQDPVLPLIVLANKQDLQNAHHIPEIHDALALSDICENRKLFLIGTYVTKDGSEISSGIQDTKEYLAQLLFESSAKVN